jgi:ABC-type transport system involved in multi-copper enzyme maturation permease subunit
MGRFSGLFLYMLGYFVILELMLVGAVLYWPNFEGNLESVRALSNPIPALRDIMNDIEETGVFGYIAGQHFFKGCNTLGTAAAVLFAVGAVAGEAHRGTLEILLARPYSRLRILLERYLAGALALTVPIFLSSATIPWLTDRVGEAVDLQSFLLGSAHQSIFLLSIYSTTFLLSTLGNNPTRIALLVLFTTTFLFAIYMIKVVTDYSFYRLCDIRDFIKIEDQRALDWTTLGPLLAASVVLFGLSYAVFRRRVP